MKVQTTKEERAERQRLEAILIDETKTEADRDFARERLQAIREGAVARAKVYAERRVDYAKAKPEPEPEFALPVKPLREENESPEDFEARLKDYWQEMWIAFQERLSAYETDRSFLGDITLCEEMFHSQAEYQEAHERWQLCLNENAAQKVLDSSSSTHSARQSAERTIRKVEKRRSELDPDASMHTGSGSTFSVERKFVDRKDDDRPFAEREPLAGFKERHPRVLEGREHGTTESQAWEGLCRFMDYLDSLPMPPQSPKGTDAHKQELQVYEAARQVAMDAVVIDHSSMNAVKPAKPFIASPLQKETWNAQSQKFARRRGEIVDSPKPVEPVRGSKFAYRLPDGTTVFPWGAVVSDPLPADVTVFPIGFPIGYVRDSGVIPDGYEVNEQFFTWTQSKK